MNLSFQFDSMAEFWVMSSNGSDHGPYVWAAYAISFACLGLIAWQAGQRRKQVVKKIKLAQLRAEQS